MNFETGRNLLGLSFINQEIGSFFFNFFLESLSTFHIHFNLDILFKVDMHRGICKSFKRFILCFFAAENLEESRQYPQSCFSFSRVCPGSVRVYVYHKFPLASSCTFITCHLITNSYFTPNISTYAYNRCRQLQTHGLILGVLIEPNISALCI